MLTPHALLSRLNAIGHSFEKSGHALAILEFLEKHFEINPTLAGEIRRLATE